MFSRPARLLLFAIVGPAAALGALIGGWFVPVVVALTHGGWDEVFRIPVEYGVFCGPPAFLEQGSTGYKVVGISQLVLWLVGTIALATPAEIWWQDLVITKLGWVTEESLAAWYERMSKFTGVGMGPIDRWAANRRARRRGAPEPYPRKRSDYRPPKDPPPRPDWMGKYDSSKSERDSKV